MRLFADNPLIERYRYSVLRPKQCWIFGFMFVTILVIMVMINLSMYIEYRTYETMAEMCASLYYQFFSLLTLILCVVCSATTAGAIREEFAERSYDFFRMLPLSAHYKAVGILVGRNLLNLIMAAVLTVLAVFTGLAGDVSLSLIIQMLFWVVAFACLFNGLSLFSSINTNRKAGAQQSQMVGIVLAVLLILPFVIGGMANMYKVAQLENYMVPFCGAEIPVLVLTACIAVYLSIWIYLGVCRKFDKESEPVMTKPGALVFLAGAMVILLGLLGPWMEMARHEGAAAVAAYWSASFLILLLLPFGFSLTGQRYMEIRSLNSGVPLLQFLLKHSNLSVCVVLYAMWAIPALVTAYAVEDAIQHAALHVVSLFAFFMIFCGLMELVATSDSLNNRLKTLLAFIAILYIFLPLIIAATSSSVRPVVFSVLGYFGIVFADSDLQDIPEVYFALAANLCFNAILAVFVKRSYHRLFPAKAAIAEQAD